MILKLFTQPSCPRCPAAKQIVAGVKGHPLAGGSRVKFEEYDVTTVDGMAEASFYTVMATPTILVCDDNGKIVKDWRGEIPSKDNIISLLR